MTDRIDFTPDYGAKENSSIIKVIGVGGGGSNAVRHMYSEGIVGVDFLVCNTDQGHLENSPIPDKLLLGAGLGAGAKPEVARQYATESKEKIREFIGEKTKMLFIAAGMGKGTGTGASPVIAAIAREMGILTIGVVCYPFNFESKKRRLIADSGIEELNKSVDSLIIVKNQNILTYYKDQNIQQAYAFADDVLKNAVKCIAELITVNYSQNVDFNDIESIMKDSGKAMLGIVTASGEDRINKLVDDALNCPLLDTTNIIDAQNFLFYVTYGPEANFTAGELGQLSQRFESILSDDADLIWGQGMDESLGDSVKLSVVITKFSAEAEKAKTTHTFIKTKEDAKDEIFTTGQDAGIRIEEKPLNISSEPTIITSSNTTPSVANDFNALINQGNAPTTDIQDNTPTISTGNTYDFYGSQIAQTNSTPFGNVSKIERQADVLFNSDEDFIKITSEPAINRINQTRTATMSTATQTMTMDRQNRVMVANDMSEFFCDFAD